MLNQMVNASGTLFFDAWGGLDTGIELWKSDGTTDGTVLVKDITNRNNQTVFQQLVALGDTVIFSADNGTYGYEFWKSDGTEAGTGLITDLSSGTQSNGLHTAGNTMAAYNGRVYAKAQQRHDRVRALVDRRHERDHPEGYQYRLLGLESAQFAAVYGFKRHPFHGGYRRHER